jgi:hypothetical protein
VNSPPPKPEVILTNFFAEPTVLLVPITSRVEVIPGISDHEIVYVEASIKPRKVNKPPRIFFPEYNIRLYDKNSESDYFFCPPPKSEYFF